MAALGSTRREAGSTEARSAEPGEAAVDLYWVPLGAGGQFVRLNGRIYEAIAARRTKRAPRDLYHSALVVTVPEGEFVIEQAWPIPNRDGVQRGVVAEGSVGTRRAGGIRALRYEIRRWRDGVIADIDEAVESPHRLSDDPLAAERVLDLVAEVPTPVWGRDELDTGEMWNSNSLISWLIARSGLDVDAVNPPAGGRAPGWHAGVVVARRQRAQRPIPKRAGDRRRRALSRLHTCSILAPRDRAREQGAHPPLLRRGLGSRQPGRLRRGLRPRLRSA